MKIELQSRRELNFRGSGTFEIELFWRFWDPKSASKRGLVQDATKLAPWAPWGRPGRLQGRKRVPPGPPKESPGEPKRLQNRIKIEIFFPMPRGRFQDLSPGAPRGVILGAFSMILGSIFEQFWEHVFYILLCNFECFWQVSGRFLVGSW